jgi:hypothetical protein
MTFSVPFARFEVMKSQVEGSFLQAEAWEALAQQLTPAG